MKRITTILAIGTTALFFTACGGGGGSSDTGGNTPAPPVETTPIPPDENADLDPSGVTKIDKFLDKYYGGDLKKDDYETTEEFNQRREDTFAPIRGNVTFLNQSSFSNTYDADTSTGKIIIKFYNSVFDSSVSDTKFLGYKHQVFYERTTSGFPGGETYHPTRSDSYIFDNIDSGLSSDSFVCETKYWYGSVSGDLYFKECSYEYYAEPSVAKEYAFNAKITINVNNSEIDHRFTYNGGNARTLNNYVGSLISYSIMNGNTTFAEIRAQ